jgi:hypothetical protein
MHLKAAEKIRVKIEELNQTTITGDTLSTETAVWVRDLPDWLHKRLAKVRLVEPRVQQPQPAPLALSAFLERFIARRTTDKPNTRTNFEQVKARLVAHFGADRNIKAITADDAEGWLHFLRERYAAGTIRRAVKRARAILPIRHQSEDPDRESICRIEAAERQEPGSSVHRNAGHRAKGPGCLP